MKIVSDPIEVWDPTSQAKWTVAVLRALRVGSAGAFVIVAGTCPDLPFIGTSPMIVDLRPVPLVIHSAQTVPMPSLCNTLVLSLADQLREVATSLSLNKSQLAEVFRVARPTLYEWFAGKEPNPANSSRLAKLIHLLTEAGVTSTAHLNARFVRHPTTVSGTSLLEALCSEDLDEPKVLSLLREAKRLGDQTAAHRKAREDRLRSLGFEDPADEQKRAQLATSVALQDWPKLGG